MTRNLAQRKRVALRTLSQKSEEVKSERGPHHKVFSVDGVDYHCYDDIGNMSVARAEQLDAQLERYAEYRIDAQQLDSILGDVLELLDPSNGTVQVALSTKILDELRNRLRLLTREETIYRAAAIMYFTADDDPGRELEESEINRRIDLFMKKKALGKVLQTPIGHILGFSELLMQDSPESLIKEIKRQRHRYNWSHLVLGMAKKLS